MCDFLAPIPPASTLSAYKGTLKGGPIEGHRQDSTVSKVTEAREGCVPVEEAVNRKCPVSSAEGMRVSGNFTSLSFYDSEKRTADGPVKQAMFSALLDHLVDISWMERRAPLGENGAKCLI